MGGRHAERVGDQADRKLERDFQRAGRAIRAHVAGEADAALAICIEVTGFDAMRLENAGWRNPCAAEARRQGGRRG